MDCKYNPNAAESPKPEFGGQQPQPQTQPQPPQQHPSSGESLKLLIFRVLRPLIWISESELFLFWLRLYFMNIQIFEKR